MKKASLKGKVKYGFDNLMSKGTAALIGWLAVISVILILIVSFIVWITNSAPDTSFIELMWMSMLRTLDPGTMGGDKGSVIFLMAMFAITLGGIFIISILIGLITTGIESKIEILRKGRSIVIEKKHTIILGWSDHVFTIIPELIEANSNLKKSCVVIMGNKDKIEMEDEIKERIGKTGSTRIVCRQGNPMDLNDLDIVNLNDSKSIIIIEESDSDVIKTMLAIVNNPKRRSEPYHIVASIKDPQNFEIAKIVGRDETEIVLVDNLISRIIAQTCRQPGLSAVYTELLDFGGDEIYFSSNKSLTGKTFKETLSMYDDSAVIGLRFNGITMLNPSMDTIIKDGDEIISISEDDDTIIIKESKGQPINEMAITSSGQTEQVPEKTLILGWNERAASIINEMDNYVVPNSKVTIVADYDNGNEELEKYCLSIVKNQTVEFVCADTRDRRILDNLMQVKYDHIIILCYTHIEVQESDAATLITLLHLRDIAEKNGLRFSIVSEMRDIRNRTLASVAKVNDFIVSDKLISLLVTQISENKLLNAVFEDIFDADGSEIYIKSASNYIKPGREVNFYDVVEAASQKNEVAFGYKIAAEMDDVDKSYGVHVNPKKSDPINFTENDGIIVLAEQ